MRMKWLVGVMTIAAALPLAAQASQSAFVAHDSIRAVDTATRRVGDTDHIVLGSHSSVSATPTATSAPEMNTGFAASGLTLLLGGIAVLRGRRNRLEA